MQVFDHCTIYVLIAGTYTPLLLSAMRPIDPVASWVLMGIVWALAAVGIAFTAIDLNKYKVFRWSAIWPSAGASSSSSRC